MKQRADDALAPRLVSLWCVPAARTRTIAVIVRVSLPPPKGATQRRAWTHVLRWNPGHKPEPGAWATLNVVHHGCRLDPSGEFLLYHGARRGVPWDAPGSEQFRAANAGGRAVSRLPWLSALTDIEGRGLFGGGSGPSRHALSAAEQTRLWSLFTEPLNLPWFIAQQPGWKAVPLEHEPDADGRRWSALQRVAAAQAELVAQAPRESGHPSFHTRFMRFALIDHATTPPKQTPLKFACWCRLEESGMLLTASSDGVLSVWRRDARPHPGSPIPGWYEKSRHTIAPLTPDPKASPTWARAPLQKTTLAKSTSTKKSRRPKDAEDHNDTAT
jgi:hypothetical protein